MSQENSSKKNLILLGVVVLLLGGAAAYYFMSSTGESASPGSTVNQAEQNLQKIEQSQTDEVKKANAPPPDIERSATKGPVKGK